MKDYTEQARFFGEVLLMIGFFVMGLKFQDYTSTGSSIVVAGGVIAIVGSLLCSVKKVGFKSELTQELSDEVSR
jgi:hypothetical protein